MRERPTVHPLPREKTPGSGKYSNRLKYSPAHKPDHRKRNAVLPHCPEFDYEWWHLKTIHVTRTVEPMNCLRNLAITLCVGLLWLPLASVPARAAEVVPKPVSFYTQIRPIFQANCQGCHQPAKAKGDYVMTEFDQLLKAGKSGDKPIVSGKPVESFLLQQITPTNGEAEMPKGKPPLHEVEIELVKRWIAEGAQDDTPANAKQHFDAQHPPVYSRPPVITSLDYSPDGALLAVAGLHEVLLQRADGSGIEARLIGLAERIQSVRFSPDGKLLAAAGGQPGRMGEVQVWDVAKRELKVSVPVGYDTVYGVSWSPDGTLISFGMPDKTVRAIEAATGKLVLKQMAHEDWALDTVFSTNGTHVISVGRDMTAKLTEVPTQRFVDNLTSITPGALRGGLLSIARHPSRDNVLIGGADGVPQIYEVFRTAARKIGDNATLLRKFPAMGGRIFSVDFAPAGNVIAAAASLDGKGSINLYAADYDPKIPEILLKAYEKTSGGYSKEELAAIEKFTTDGVKLLHHLDVPSAVYAISFSPDGKRLAAGTSAGVILGINVETGGLELVFSAAPITSASETSAPVVVDRPALAAKVTEDLKPEALPKGAHVVALTAHPEKITLANRNEHAQLIVTAVLASGDTVDVTRLATFGVGEDLGSVNSRGRFTARRSGQGFLLANFGGKSTRVPVDLAGFETAFRADFIRDVNPVLSKLGCNAGTCHGAKDGKNGFKLSLRGYDSVFDVRAFADDLASRRVNLAAADESLMLLKATGAVPHEGSQRTTTDSEYYAILRQWIADGARLDLKASRVTGIAIFPRDPTVQEIGSKQQMRIVATYADGATRDVTGDAFIESGNMDVAAADDRGLITTLRRGEAPILARFDGNYAATTLTVMGDRSGFVWQEPPANNRIDELVAAKWQRLKILPSALCTDDEFIRRVTLDLIGLPPTADQVREFLTNPRDQRSKRDALIERLLNSPDYVDHWASKWADLLQVNRKFLGEEGARLFRDWIKDQITSNRPYDQFVANILTATGSNKDHPAASYWKILREPTEAMENTTHLFLATRFNCNKCHDHPFERWTQDQYYNLSQYFAQVDLKKDDASGDRKVGGTAVEGAKPLFEIVSDKQEGSVAHNRSGKPVPPHFPFAAKPRTEGTNETRRAELSAWITSPDNRYFALSYVNRLWGYLLGVGIIEPLDDIRAGNPPGNPVLLDHLTREFIESGFNTRHIIRQICQSRVYQLSLTTQKWNVDDKLNYSHALPRRLPAEVLLDAVYAATGSTPNFPGAKPGVRAAQLVDSSVDVPSGFLANLGRPARESACECERGSDIKLSSVMALLSGPAVADAVSDPDNALTRLVRTQPDNGKLADELFLRVLNRHATATELSSVAKYATALEQEHARLTNDLAKAEEAWAERKPKLEQDRDLAISGAEQALTEYLQEQAPKRALAQRQRHEGIALTEGQITEYEPALAGGAAAWEASLTTNHFAAVWELLDVKNVEAGGSARLRTLPDGSILSVASIGELPSYTVTGETTLPNITGLKIEALPHADLPNFGPGHADGDFMLSEVELQFASKTNATQFATAKIAEGATDLIVAGHQLSQMWNGIGEQGRKEGWSIGKSAIGRPHWATFALAKPVGDTNGSLVRVTVQHRYEAPFEIGRFRIWVTRSAVPTAEGLSSEIAGLVKIAPKLRSEPQRARLLAHYRTLDSEMLKRDFRAELARKALPEDDRLKQLELELARATKPVLTDPIVVQLRKDVALSNQQLERKRLTATQDLAWALINTPSFLFNR